MSILTKNEYEGTLQTDNILTIISPQDSHTIGLRAPWKSTEVWQQPEESLQRGLQQVWSQLFSEERRQPDQRLAIVTPPV